MNDETMIRCPKCFCFRPITIKECQNCIDKLNTFRNMISEFIDENCIVRTGDMNAEILFDESDGGKILEKNIKELFDEVRRL